MIAAATTNVTVRMDLDVKKKFEEIVSDFGLNMSTAINAFARAVVRDEAIPFDFAQKKDTFYSEANMAALRKSIAQAERGELITFNSIEEAEQEARRRNRRNAC